MFSYGPVAQGTEHRSPKAGVARSNRAGVTTKKPFQTIGMPGLERAFLFPENVKYRNKHAASGGQMGGVQVLPLALPPAVVGGVGNRLAAAGKLREQNGGEDDGAAAQLTEVQVLMEHEPAAEDGKYRFQ